MYIFNRNKLAAIMQICASYQIVVSGNISMCVGYGTFLNSET